MCGFLSSPGVWLAKIIWTASCRGKWRHTNIALGGTWCGWTAQPQTKREIACWTAVRAVVASVPVDQNILLSFLRWNVARTVVPTPVTIFCRGEGWRLWCTTQLMDRVPFLYSFSSKKMFGSSPEKPNTNKLTNQLWNELIGTCFVNKNWRYSFNFFF